MGDEGRGHRVGGDHRQRARRTCRWWRCRPPWPTSRRSPTGSRSCTGPSWPIYHPAAAGAAALLGRRPRRRDPRLRRGAARARARASATSRAAPDDRGRWYTRRVVDPTVLIDALEQRGWLPAIYFIFSRAGLRARDGGRARRGQAADHARAAAARSTRRSREALADSPTIGESPLNQIVFRGLRIGVALHHAGILPGAQAPDRVALRARPLQGRLRHRDHVARHPHAGARRGAAGRSPSAPTAASARSPTTS